MSATMLVGLSLTRASVPYCWRFLGAALSISGPNRTLRTSCPTFSGHNKWSKVKNIKGPKDLERSRIFQKLSMMIRLTVREGGPNPDLNRHLANVIEQCRSKNMPKASIEAAISGGDKAKASSHLLYGVRGPGGSCLLVEVLADNTTRFLNRLRYLLNRHGGLLADSAHHSFDRKGVILAGREEQESGADGFNQALDLAIEAGAEDVKEEEDEEERPVLKFVCAVSALHEVREKLHSLGLPSLSAGLEFIPSVTVELSDAEMEQAAHLLAALREHPDIVRVYDNIV